MAQQLLSLTSTFGGFRGQLAVLGELFIPPHPLSRSLEQRVHFGDLDVRRHGAKLDVDPRRPLDETLRDKVPERNPLRPLHARLYVPRLPASPWLSAEGLECAERLEAAFPAILKAFHFHQLSGPVHSNAALCPRTAGAVSSDHCACSPCARRGKLAPARRGEPAL